MSNSPDLLVKVYMRRMDYRHIISNLEHRAKQLYDDESAEVLEILRKNNPKLEES